MLSGRPADGCGELGCVALPGRRGMIIEGDLARRLSGPREWGETGDWVRMGNWDCVCAAEDLLSSE